MVNPFTTVPAMLLGGYDKIQKRKVWKEYARQGDVYAQWDLASSYCCSEFEGKRNYRQAIRWFCAAAENGYAKAQLHIGDLYAHNVVYKDVVVTKNEIDAYAWYSLAARRINTEAIEKRLALMDKMTDVQLEQAEEKFQRYDELSCKSMMNQ